MMRYPDLEIDLLRAFVAAADSGSFTGAALVVGRSQSAVSQKIARLEEILGNALFERSSRSLSLTREGEKLLVAARRMLEFNDATVRALVEAPAAGSLRLGISEDFVPRQLPVLLARFGRLYPDVQITLHVGLSCDLLEAYDAGELDVVIAKKDGNAQRGRVIWREPLVWLAAADAELASDQPLPLIMLPAPCTYRNLMIQSLDNVRRDWTIACTSSSLMGIQAAVAAGLGVTVLGRSFAGPGTRIIHPSERWPALPMTEIVIIGEEGAPGELVSPLLDFLTDSLSGQLEAA